MKIKEAIRISSSIPFFFDPVEFRGEFYIDGGITDSYPFGYFDNDLETLGFKLKFKIFEHGDDKGDSESIFYVKDYIYNFMKTVYE